MPKPKEESLKYQILTETVAGIFRDGMSFRFEFRNRKRFLHGNTNSSRNWNTSYAETLQGLVIFALRSSFPICSCSSSVICLLR